MGYTFLDNHAHSGACRIFIYGAMGVKWTTLTFKELAAPANASLDAAGYWIKKKKKEAASASGKQQAQASSGKRLTDSNK